MPDMGCLGGGSSKSARSSWYSSSMYALTAKLYLPLSLSSTLNSSWMALGVRPGSCIALRCSAGKFATSCGDIFSKSNYALTAKLYSPLSLSSTSNSS